MKHIDHIGIAVKKLEISIPLFQRILNSNCDKIEEVESEKVRTAFFQKGETKVELLESLDSQGVIAKYIDKKGEGIHHIAILVENIDEEIERLKKEGLTILSAMPFRGADNKLVCFLHPKETGGVLIEICQEIAK